MSNPPTGWSSAPRAIGLFAWAMLVWLLVMWGGTYFQSRFGRNCGFYLPLAIQVAEGKQPYVDFWYPYSPGAIYLYAALGASSLHNPLVAKSVAYVSLWLCLGLTFATLRRLGHTLAISWFFALLSSVWVFCLGAWVVSTETLTTTFLLLAAFLLIRFPNWWGAIFGGLAAGTALMMKQFALLELPVLALMAALPPLAFGEPTRAAPPERHWARMFIFALLVAVPFLVWVAATGVPFMDAFYHCATWGGHADQHGLGNGLQAVLQNLTDDSSTSLALFSGLVGLWLLMLEPSRLNWQLLGLYGLGLLPLFVREFDGYVQYSAIWATLILAQFSRALALRFGGGAALQAALALLLAIPLVQLCGWGTLFLAKEISTSTLGKQRAVAAQVVEALPQRDDVLVINHEWLYYLADLRPPELNYKPVQSFDLAYSAPQRDAARLIVYMPDASRRLGGDTVAQFLAEGGFEPLKTLAWSQSQIEIWSRPLAANAGRGEAADTAETATEAARPPNAVLPSKRSQEPP